MEWCELRRNPRQTHRELQRDVAVELRRPLFQPALKTATKKMCASPLSHTRPRRRGAAPAQLQSYPLHQHNMASTTMQSQIWSSTIPLHISHQSSPIPYLIQVPRVSYLPLLLPRLTSFFGHASSFSYEGILLKNLPVGLLCDLYEPELPWRLTLGNEPEYHIHDTYINSVKEVGSTLQPRQVTRPDIVTGRLHTLWNCKGHNVHV